MLATQLTTEKEQELFLEPYAVRAILIGIGTVFIVLFALAPLVCIFVYAFEKGLGAYLLALREPETMAALRLTLITACLVLPVNTIFGFAAAWLITHFEFRAKSLLVTLIELPLSISPVVAGMLFVLAYGNNGPLAPLLKYFDTKIIFAPPGIILATLFITAPYVFKQVYNSMDKRGTLQDEAGVSLGANGIELIIRIVIPGVLLGLIPGMILCNARAIGEFGAVSVVSGHIRGETTTLPLQIEMLYNEYKLVPAFAVASLLTLIAMATILINRMFSSGEHGDSTEPKNKF